MMQRNRILPNAVFFTLFYALALPAQAQGVLEEIVVTAQKREQNIQDVPISITRMSGQWLESKFAGGGDVLELASTVPGLHVESSNGRLSPRFYMRGLGNADFTAAASQPVSIVFDEVPMEKASLKAFPIFDLDDIEVIRGPQGTLFGRNTTAGIIKFDSRRPTEETEGYIKASGGNLGTINVEGAVGGTLVENTLMGRLSFITQHRSDWVNNAYTGEDDAMGGFDIFAGRAKLLWTPTDDFSALLLYQHQDQGGNSASLFRANIFDKGSNKLNDNYDRNTVWFDGGNNNPAKIKSFGVPLKLDWDVGDHTITSITSYQDIYDRFARGDIDGGYGCLLSFVGLCQPGPAGPPSTPFNPAASPFTVNLDTGGDQEVEQITQEIRVASNLDGPFNYQVGAFYFEDDLLSVSQNQSAGAPAFIVGSISQIENTTWAVFGQGSYSVSDQLTLTAGVRYTDDEKDAQHERPAVEGVLDPISLADDELSWDVSLAFAVSDDAQVYARVATGFRAPTIQDRLEDDPVATIADSETIMSYEIGYKALFDKVRLNVAGFYYEVDDMQLVAVGGDANATTLLNANEGVGYGVEFDVDIALTENMVLSGGFGYNKTELNDKELTLPIPPHGLVTSRDPLDENGRAIIDGNPFQHAPKWTANLQLDYTHP
ncbi:MAG: TonB-dependent receptor, partial [Gammaproteobacteria bacterium]|nr:TonB-dependent receptor [Gammaproteobacteria bacterium]